MGLLNVPYISTDGTKLLLQNNQYQHLFLSGKISRLQKFTTHKISNFIIILFRPVLVAPPCIKVIATFNFHLTQEDFLTLKAHILSCHSSRRGRYSCSCFYRATFHNPYERVEQVTILNFCKLITPWQFL